LLRLTANIALFFGENGRIDDTSGVGTTRNEWGKRFMHEGHKKHKGLRAKSEEI